MTIAMSRRELARLLGGSAACAAAAPAAHAAGTEVVGESFPAGFLWGSATASYQVEGAVQQGGRGKTIWDTFSHTPGKTYQGDTGDVADDFYNRFPQDIALMKELGLKTFRFSMAWSRIFPDGVGTPNQQGLDFYRRLADTLLEAGIEPYCTLFHWDLPQALQDKGGWQSRDTAEAFAAYAGFVAGKLSDRIRHFMTLNEMRTFVEMGNRDGIHAPGLKLGPKPLAQLAHHMVLGHGLGVQAIRAAGQPGTRVGLAENVLAMVPVIETQQHIAAARTAMREENAMFLTAVLEGRYTEGYLRKLGADAPVFTDAEMKAIGSPLDFVGTNIYTPTYVQADDSPSGYRLTPLPQSYPAMYSRWLIVGPEAMYWGPKLVHELWGVKAIYITENGTSSAEVVQPDGQIWDIDRVMYLRNYLLQLRRAVREGVPVKGYFLWSLLDNFEWADGYSKRFGIVYVDYATQKRIPKLSAAFYKETIRRNAVA